MLKGIKSYLNGIIAIKELAHMRGRPCQDICLSHIHARTLTHISIEVLNLKNQFISP